MKLRTKLLLATTATAIVVLGISEWFSYQQTVGFLRGHALQMERSFGAASAAEFRRAVEGFAGQLTLLHVLHAAAEAAALLLVLSVFWSRLVLRPLRELLGQINLAMCAPGSAVVRGRTTTDEFREMSLEVGQIEQRLTTALQDAKAAGELSAVALLAKAAVRRMDVARDQLAGALTAIAAAERRREPAPETAIRSLEAVLHRLVRISQEFDAVPGLQIESNTTAADTNHQIPLLAAH